VVGSYEHGNEPLGTIKGGEFVDWVTISFLRTLLVELDGRVNQNTHVYWSDKNVCQVI
jgi:hypothetical protein